MRLTEHRYIPPLNVDERSGQISSKNSDTMQSKLSAKPISSALISFSFQAFAPTRTGGVVVKKRRTSCIPTSAKTSVAIVKLF